MAKFVNKLKFSPKKIIPVVYSIYSIPCWGPDQYFTYSYSACLCVNLIAQKLHLVAKTSTLQAYVYFPTDTSTHYDLFIP